jgi:hypothetical protein
MAPGSTRRFGRAAPPNDHWTRARWRLGTRERSDVRLIALEKLAAHLTVMTAVLAELADCRHDARRAADADTGNARRPTRYRSNPTP